MALNNGKQAENIYKNLDLAKKGYSKEELASIESAIDEGKGIDEIKKVYKNPIEQAEAISKVAPFNKEAIVSYLKNYGSGFDDDAYEEWATKKGKELKKTPLNKDFIGTDYHKQWYGEGHDYTYAPQYLEDEEWLQEVWPDIADDANEYYKLKGGK